MTDNPHELSSSEFSMLIRSSLPRFSQYEIFLESFNRRDLRKPPHEQDLLKYHVPDFNQMINFTTIPLFQKTEKVPQHPPENFKVPETKKNDHMFSQSSD